MITLADDFQDPLDFALSELPMIHKDPFDRILIAQAKSENLILVTDDNMIKEYDVIVMGR
ncbi:MAG: PIN domain-containing protein [Desulfococcaceae bacterium]|jgi:PIN domain nuclease of toxin-antitoxin system|nr:PIN domain-containing protein [Desulfococcaceae bacterium]